MNTATFDTLSAARSLEAAGIESKQAEAIVGAIRSSGEASVTRTDAPEIFRPRKGPHFLHLDLGPVLAVRVEGHLVYGS